MKIGGVQVTASEETLVLPREGGDIVIKAQAYRIGDEFDKRCPLPTPPMVTTKDGPAPDFSDKHYKAAITVRDERRFAYLVLKSIEPSDIEWETVDIDKPATWDKWGDELMDAGLTEVEVNRIVNAVLAANSLDEEKIKQARERFLRGQGA